MRERQLNIRLNAEEEARFEAVAKRYGLNVPGAVRMLLHREANTLDAMTLPVTLAACTFHLVGSPTDALPERLIAELHALKVTAETMRALGVTKYGSIEIGPLPASAPADDDEPQRIDPATLEKRAREERRRVAMGSSGGPLKRVDSD